MESQTKEFGGDAAGTAYWDQVWDKLPPVPTYPGPIFEQHPVFAKYLSKTNGDAIEIGCVPGNFMVYLHHEFGYRVDGLDYCGNMDYVRRNLQHNNIHDSNLFNADLFNFVSGKKYDLVFSGGFVEHFDNYELVVQKHADLAKNGGYVVIFFPNLTHIHKLLCGWFAPEVLRIHRFALMNKQTLRDTLEKAGLRVLHCDYQKTFRPTYQLPTALQFGSRAFQKLLRMTRLDNIGNRYGSPYLISVSVKT
ncbi:MAG TPA: methyltransferase domain-containing protein [Terriglobales bacterium]|jgi:SAM-dependent methyltransferase|nr:methyltransferase domain-containing protein [Terriglobales bacterium]